MLNKKYDKYIYAYKGKILTAWNTNMFSRLCSSMTKECNSQIINSQLCPFLTGWQHAFSTFVLQAVKFCELVKARSYYTIVVLRYRTAHSCDVTALRCRMKVKFILTWNAVTLDRDVINISAPQRNCCVVWMDR